LAVSLSLDYPFPLEDDFWLGGQGRSVLAEHLDEELKGAAGVTPVDVAISTY
jgi:hypothetical protein